MSIKTSRRETLKLAATSALVVGVSGSIIKLTPSEQAPQTQQAPYSIAPLICNGCGSSARCGNLFVRRGAFFYILPNLSHPQPGICARGASMLQVWNHPLRLKKPLKRVGNRGEGKFQEVDWDTALNEAAAKLKEIVEKYGPEAVAFTRHDTFAWHLSLIAALIGTPNVVGADSVCRAESTAARYAVFGVKGPAEVDPDYANASYVMLVARVLAAPMLMTRLLSKARDGGVKIVVVDPRAPNIAFSSVEWIPIIPGTDAAFLLSMIYVIINEGLYDAQFLKRYTNAPMLIKPDGTPLTQKDLGQEGSAYLVFDAATSSIKPLGTAADPALDYEGDVETPSGAVHVKTAFKLLAERASKYTPDKAAQITGIPADTIIRIAREFATHRGVIDDGWYSTRNGTDFEFYKAIAILNALVGNIDKRGGLCFQESTKFPKSATIGPDKVDTIFGVSLPPIKAERVDILKRPLAATSSSFEALLDTILTGKPYPIKALIIVGTGPFHRNNSEMVKKAFQNLDLIISIDILPQDHIDWSDYVFPDLMFLERIDIWPVTWSLDAGVIFSNKVLDPPPGVDARHALWVLLELVRRAWPEKAAQIGYTEKYADYSQFKLFEEQLLNHILNHIAKTWNISKEDLERKLKTEGYYILKKKEYETRPYKSKLSTPTGLVEIYPLALLKYGLDPLPDLRPPAYKTPSAPNEFYLVSGKDQFVSGHFVFTWNSKHLTDRSVWMNPLDAERLGIKDGDVVTLEGQNGFTAKARIKVTNRVRPGVLFAYPLAGGHTSSLIKEPYNFLKEGINPHKFTPEYYTPVIGSGVCNAVVRVRL